MKTAIELIAEERQRQIEVEGWTTEHDDQQKNGELAEAASCYAKVSTPQIPPKSWPWNWNWWKATPYNRIRQLTKAGALIVAEIERIQRAEQPHTAEEEAGKSNEI